MKIQIQIQAYDKSTRMGVPLVFEGSPAVRAAGDYLYINLTIDGRDIQIPRDELYAAVRLFF